MAPPASPGTAALMVLLGSLLHEGAFSLGPRQWTRLAAVHGPPLLPLLQPADDPVEHLGLKLGSLDLPCQCLLKLKYAYCKYLFINVSQSYQLLFNVVGQV